MSNFGTVKPFATKGALREAVKVLGADNVEVYDTSAFRNRGTIKVSELRGADMIVGPDPYTKRNWYANVTTVKGEIRIA